MSLNTWGQVLGLSNVTQCGREVKKRVQAGWSRWRRVPGFVIEGYLQV